jgi:hypothetical protein
VIEDYSVGGEEGGIGEIGSLQLLLEPAFHGRNPTVCDVCLALNFPEADLHTIDAISLTRVG